MADPLLLPGRVDPPGKKRNPGITPGRRRTAGNPQGLARARSARSPDLFSHAREEILKQEAPLAARMRPRDLSEFIGQEHIVGEGRVLRKAIEADQLPSIILWGPPGSGKTTLAYVIAGVTRSHFSPISAVAAGVADLRRIVNEAKARRKRSGQRTILFIDEIHRF